MALCGLAALFAVALILVTLGVRGRRLYASAGLFALSPIAVGPISLNTYDLFPGRADRRRAGCDPAPARAARLRPPRPGRDREALSARARATGGRVRLDDARAAAGPRGRSLRSRASLLAICCPSPCSRRAGSGTASTRSRRGGSRSRASARRCCSPRTSSASTRRPSCEARPEPPRATSPARCRTRLATVTSVLQVAAVVAGLAPLPPRAEEPGATRARLDRRGRGLPRLQPLRLAAVPRLADPARAALPGRTGLVATGLVAALPRARPDLVLPLQPTCSRSTGSPGSSSRATPRCSRSTCCCFSALKTSTPSSEKTSRQSGLRRSRASSVAVANGSQRSA